MMLTLVYYANFHAFPKSLLQRNGIQINNITTFMILMVGVLLGVHEYIKIYSAHKNIDNR
jgi:hypothetical protein